MANENKTRMIDIREVTLSYLPVSRKKARRFVSLYLDVTRVGNRMYVDRKKLEELLSDPERESFPLNI